MEPNNLAMTKCHTTRQVIFSRCSVWEAYWDAVGGKHELSPKDETKHKITDEDL